VSVCQSFSINKLLKTKQDAQLSQRDRATRTSVEILSDAVQPYENTFEKARGKWTIFKVKVTEPAGRYPMGHTSSCTVSEILPYLEWKWLRVTFRSHSFLKRQLKLQATCTFRFMSKHSVDNTYHIFRGIGVRKVLDRKSDLQRHSRTLAMVQATHNSLLVFHCNRVSILHRLRDIITYFPQLKEITLPWAHLFLW